MQYLKNNLLVVWKKKFDIKNLVNFCSISRRSENLHFDWLVLSQAYKVLDGKITKGLCLMTLKSDPKKS